MKTPSQWLNEMDRAGTVRDVWQLTFIEAIQRDALMAKPKCSRCRKMAVRNLEQTP